MMPIFKKNKQTEQKPPAYTAKHYRESSPLLHPDIMTDLYLEGKLLEDISMAQSEKFWLENPPWSPSLVQMEITQFTGHNRFGMEMGKKKESIFSLKYCILIFFPNINQKFPHFFVKLSPSLLSIIAKYFEVAG